MQSLSATFRASFDTEADKLVDPRFKEVIALCRGGSTERFDELMKTDVDINARDAHGMTPIQLAACRGARPYALSLLKTGRCDLTLKSPRGLYAYQHAIQHAHDYAMGRLLLRLQTKQEAVFRAAQSLAASQPEPL